MFRCGKTTVCQLGATLQQKQLLSINCHLHTEAADFLGGLRPVRSTADPDSSRFFEWVDGPLVRAMKEGHVLLVDEISLADDSVLERLNSVLEVERSLLLSEKGGGIDTTRDSIEQIVAKEEFRLVATMNPGGDYGKKEVWSLHTALVIHMARRFSDVKISCRFPALARPPKSLHRNLVPSRF